MTKINGARWNGEKCSAVRGTVLMASETDYQQMIADFQAGGCGYGDFKKRLFEAYWEFFAPMREKRAELLEDPGYVDQVLTAGAAKAREEADRVLTRVRSAVGLR